MQPSALPVTAGNPARRIVRIAAPLVGHGVVTVVVTMNDSFLLGSSGAAVLGAAAASGAIVTVGTLLMTGLVGTPTQILVARAVGAKQLDEAAHTAERPVPIATTLAALLIIALTLVAVPLTAAIGGTAIDAPLSADMLRIVVWSLPFAGIAAIARGYATGHGATRIVVVAAIVAAVVDVAFSVALLQVVGPLGVTIGTVLAQAAGCLTFLTWLARQPAGSSRPHLLRACGRLPGRVQREPFWLGWSDGLLGATSAGAGVVTTVLLSTSTPVVLAGTRVLDAMLVIAWVILMGITSAGLTLLSQARGADAPAEYRQALVGMGIVGTIIAAVLALGFPWITEPVLRLTVGAEIAAEAGSVAWLAWAGAPWIFVTSAALAVCRSFRDTRTPLWSSLLAEYAVFLPVGWLLCRILNLGIVGLFWTHQAYYLGFLCVAGTVAVRHLRRPWTAPSRYEAPVDA